MVISFALFGSVQGIVVSTLNMQGLSPRISRNNLGQDLTKLNFDYTGPLLINIVIIIITIIFIIT